MYDIHESAPVITDSHVTTIKIIIFYFITSYDTKLVELLWKKYTIKKDCIKLMNDEKITVLTKLLLWLIYAPPVITNSRVTTIKSVAFYFIFSYDTNLV